MRLPRLRTTTAIAAMATGLGLAPALLSAAPAHAAGTTIDIPVPDPTTGCTKHFVVDADSSRIPPVIVRVYVSC
ncbi:MAG: hypothetical protein QOD07_2549 [Frankiaceae bacterium]|jgi:hypothetical protein|nr:hypothetical protein [Frankiaceae bacterium]